MRKIPPIKSMMTPFPCITLSRHALQYMQEHNIHHLPVTDGKRLIGVIQNHEILRHPDTAVSELEFDTPLVFDLDTRFDLVLDAMAENRKDTALITRNEKLVGIFTYTDACRAFAAHLRDEFRPPDGDEAA